MCTREECIIWRSGVKGPVNSDKSICSNMSFKTGISLIFCSDDQFKAVNVVFRCPAIIVFLSVSPFSSVISRFIYFGAS